MLAPQIARFPHVPPAFRRHFRGSGWLLGFALLLPAAAGDFEKSTAYFNNLYGLPESTRSASAYEFRQAGATVVVTGRFAVREYRRPDLQIEAVFLLPDLRLAAVTLQRPRAWTFGEFEGELAAYGSRWRRLNRNFLLSPAGVHATYEGHALHFISPEIAGLMEEQVDKQ